MKRNIRAFSLVELVIVIVIVGLLAVAALPKFLDVVDAAKQASVEAVAGGYAIGVLSARAQWEAESRPSTQIGNESYNSVDYDGTSFWLTRSENGTGQSTGYRDGYPFALKTSTYPAALTAEICVELMENLLQNPPKVGVAGSADVTAGNGYRYSASARRSNVNSAADTCTYYQLEGDTTHHFDYEIKTGRVTVTLD